MWHKIKMLVLGLLSRKHLAAAVLCALIIAISMGLFSTPAFADAMPAGTCTTDPPFQIPSPAILSTITSNIQAILNQVTKTLYLAIVTDYGFIRAVSAAVTLYIVIYGILFTFGMVQITIFDFVMRMIKIGIIVLLISPQSWTFFSNEVIYFFNRGTDCLIDQVTTITVGGVPGSSPGACATGTGAVSPFVQLDSALSKAISAKMAVTLQAIAFTGVYGFVYLLLLLACLGAFVKAMLTALWVYLMSLVVRTLLFGIAPIFIACLLFNRTRHLFDGWLNQVVNACLQPLLLFIFFSFFAKLIEASIDQILHVPVCWTEAAESVRGSPFNFHFWRPSVLNQASNYEPYGGNWTFTGPQDAQYESRIFPLDIVAVLVFFMLAQLANRFNSVVLMVARELAGATTDLSSMQGALGDWFGRSRNAGGVLSSMSNSRPGAIGMPGVGAAGTIPGRERAGGGLTGARPGPGSSR